VKSIGADHGSPLLAGGFNNWGAPYGRDAPALPGV
jgi:hypothetical protein